MRYTYSKSSIQRERGSALIPALMVVSTLAMLGLSMLSAGLSGSRVVTGQSDEFRLTSAVESVGALTADHLWSAYLREHDGAADTIATFRGYLTSIGIQNIPSSTPPSANQGVDLSGSVGLAGNVAGYPELDDVRIESVRVARHDDGDTTRLYVTIAASTKRGAGHANAPVQRAIQLVYAISPAPFEGFDYGILTNNVNCVFCHTVIDSAERVYNHDPSKFGTFDKVKVGTLQSLMLRHDPRPAISDWDSDSMIAGSLYVRGHATNQNGIPMTNWGGTVAFKSTTFDVNGHIVQNETGGMSTTTFSPAGDPPQPGENMYLNYPTDYAAMPDGKLPVEFPPPFPDDGGVDPLTGHQGTTGAGNRLVDPLEFQTAAARAEGTVSGGVITLVDPADPIDTQTDYVGAFTQGNTSSLPSVTHGNVVLTGTTENPIVIHGTVAIEGDVVINGYVKGEGVILASRNVYVPTDLRYLDGHTYVEGDEAGNPTGPVTFGVAQDGTKNALGLACGGNMMLGDYLAPSPSLDAPEEAIVTGNPDGPWNFPLSEISLFNRNEWSHTQPFLPGHGQDNFDPSTWTVPNPGYIADYVPRFYQFGPGDVIPIYNLGNVWFDATSGTWRGDAEVPLGWDPGQLTLFDPADLTNPLLYDPTTGAPRATVLQLDSNSSWITNTMLEHAIETMEDHHATGTPMQIDGLLYTNNAIFGVVTRGGPMRGQMVVNGSLVCADLGLLSPGHLNTQGLGTTANVPHSPVAVGLRVNYDKRTKSMLNVTNPYSVTIRRALWNPHVNVQ